MLQTPSSKETRKNDRNWRQSELRTLNSAPWVPISDSGRSSHRRTQSEQRMILRFRPRIHTNRHEWRNRVSGFSPQVSSFLICLSLVYWSSMEILMLMFSHKDAKGDRDVEIGGDATPSSRHSLEHATGRRVSMNLRFPFQLSVVQPFALLVPLW